MAAQKAAQKSFVARYGAVGVVTFVDGHVESIDGKGVLEENGQFKFPLGLGDADLLDAPGPGYYEQLHLLHP